jgi:hypothetical protein
LGMAGVPVIPAAAMTSLTAAKRSCGSKAKAYYGQ